MNKECWVIFGYDNYEYSSYILGVAKTKEKAKELFEKHVRESEYFKEAEAPHIDLDAFCADSDPEGREDYYQVIKAENFEIQH